MNKMNSQDINILHNLLLDYIKEKNKFPFLSNLISYNDTYKVIFSNFKDENDLKDIYLEYFSNQILKWKWKFMKWLKSEYLNNKDFFTDFFLLNLDKNNIHFKHFHEKWENFKKIVENLKLKLNLNDTYKNKTNLFYDSNMNKIDKNIKLIFPYYNYIWVQVSQK